MADTKEARSFSVTFTIDSEYNPIELIHELQIQAGGSESIVSLQAYIGGIFVCSLKDETHYSNLLSNGKFRFRGKPYDLKPVETNIVNLLVKRLHRGISNDAIFNFLAAYGKVLLVEREVVTEMGSFATGNRRVVIELRRNLPRFLRIRGCNAEIELC